MYNLNHIPLLTTKDNTQKCRITLSANAIKILESLALGEINTINKHSPQVQRVLKELYLAATKTSSKLEIGMGVSYNTNGAVGISLEEKLGLDTNEFPAVNKIGNASAKIKTESELLMEMSEEDRNKILLAYQEELMKEFSTTEAEHSSINKESE